MKSIWNRGTGFSPPVPLLLDITMTNYGDELNEGYFWDVIRYPVHFEKAVENMLAKGDYIFIDLGPSGTLATFVKYILTSDSGSVAMPTINQYGKDLNAMETLSCHFNTAVLN